MKNARAKARAYYNMCVDDLHGNIKNGISTGIDCTVYNDTDNVRIPRDFDGLYNRCKLHYDIIDNGTGVVIYYN